MGKDPFRGSKERFDLTVIEQKVSDWTLLVGCDQVVCFFAM
jgi:hypothetical protein